MGRERGPGGSFCPFWLWFDRDVVGRKMQMKEQRVPRRANTKAKVGVIFFFTVG